MNIEADELGIPEYEPSILKEDSEQGFERPENLHIGEIKQLIREYLSKVDRETLEIVLCVLRDRKWGSEET